MPDKPLEPPDERHWWEMQLGLRLPRSLRHPSPLVRLEPPADVVEKRAEPGIAAQSPPDEHRWWAKQLGKKIDDKT